MELLSAGDWGLYLFALVAIASVAALAGIGVGVILKDRWPRA